MEGDEVRVIAHEAPHLGSVGALELFRPVAEPPASLAAEMLGQGLEGGMGLKEFAAFSTKTLEGRAITARLEIRKERVEEWALERPHRLVVHERTVPQRREASLPLRAVQQRLGRAAGEALTAVGSMKIVSRNRRDDGEYGDTFVRSAENNAWTGLGPGTRPQTRPSRRRPQPHPCNRRCRDCGRTGASRFAPSFPKGGRPRAGPSAPNNAEAWKSGWLRRSGPRSPPQLVIARRESRELQLQTAFTRLYRGSPFARAAPFLGDPPDGALSLRTAQGDARGRSDRDRDQGRDQAILDPLDPPQGRLRIGLGFDLEAEPLENGGLCPRMGSRSSGRSGPGIRPRSRRARRSDGSCRPTGSSRGRLREQARPGGQAGLIAADGRARAVPDHAPPGSSDTAASPLPKLATKRRAPPSKRQVTSRISAFGSAKVAP